MSSTDGPSATQGRDAPSVATFEAVERELRRLVPAGLLQSVASGWTWFILDGRVLAMARSSTDLPGTTEVVIPAASRASMVHTGSDAELAPIRGAIEPLMQRLGMIPQHGEAAEPLHGARSAPGAAIGLAAFGVAELAPLLTRGPTAETLGAAGWLAPDEVAALSDANRALRLRDRTLFIGCFSSIGIVIPGLLAALFLPALLTSPAPGSPPCHSG